MHQNLGELYLAENQESKEQWLILLNLINTRQFIVT